MNKLLYVFVIFLIFAVACTQRKNVGHDSSVTIESVAEGKNEEIQLPGRIFEDTIAGRWHLKTSKLANDVKISDVYTAFMDTSVYLSLSYDGNPVFTNKEIRTLDLMGEEGEYFMAYGGGLKWASDSAIYISFGCYIPSSSFGWDILYQIKPDGQINLITIDYDYGPNGYLVIHDFLTLYFSERAVGVPVNAMRPLLEKFCTPALTDELLAGRNPLESYSMDYQNAQHTYSVSIISDFFSDSIDVFDYSVEWKPYKKDENITDIITLSVSESSFIITDIKDSGRRII